MEQITLTTKVAQNVAAIKGIIGKDQTLRVREFTPEHNPGLPCAALYMEGMVDNVLLTESILQPMVEMPALAEGEKGFDVVFGRVLANGEVKSTTELSTLLDSLLYGDTIVFVEGDTQAIICNTKGFLLRSVSEPESERVLRGSREGFIESVVMNISMLRRRLVTPDFKCEFLRLGEISNTACVIAYVEGRVEPSVLKELKKRLSKVKTDVVLDSNYISERIRDNPRSPFRTIGSTERPDVVAAKLLEGRVALLVDGTPMVLTMPCLYAELMQSPDDYYLNYYYASFGRLMRMLCAFLSYSVPSLYLALITFHQELIPPSLLLNIAQARDGVPLPSFLEALLLMFAFDLLRETGARMPTAIGQTLSIVGALVLGQAAVEARFVSAPMIIIIAFSGITSLIVPKLSGASILNKYVFLVLTALYGLYGYVCGMTLTLAHLFSLESFGVPYMSYSYFQNIKNGQDIYIRAPFSKMKKSPVFPIRTRWSKEARE